MILAGICLAALLLVIWRDSCASQARWTVPKSGSSNVTQNRFGKTRFSRSIRRPIGNGAGQRPCSHDPRLRMKRGQEYE